MLKQVLLPLAVAVAFALSLSLACNEAICASIVSKCMLTQSCKCDKLNVTCSRDCFYCLDYLYTECCSCVDSASQLCASLGVVLISSGKRMEKRVQ